MWIPIILYRGVLVYTRREVPRDALNPSTVSRAQSVRMKRIRATLESDWSPAMMVAETTPTTNAKSKIVTVLFKKELVDWSSLPDGVLQMVLGACLYSDKQGPRASSVSHAWSDAVQTAMTHLAGSRHAWWSAPYQPLRPVHVQPQWYDCERDEAK